MRVPRVLLLSYICHLLCVYKTKHFIVHEMKVLAHALSLITIQVGVSVT